MEITPRAIAETRRRLISFVGGIALALTVVVAANERRWRNQGHDRLIDSVDLQLNR